MMVRKKKDTPKFDKETVIELYDEATEPTGSMREFVFDYADEFFRKRLSLELVGDFADTVSEGSLHEALEILNDATRRLNQSTDEDDGVAVRDEGDIRSSIDRIVDELQDDGKSITTGIPSLDDYLLGGTRPGELGVVMAPPGHGKSQLLIFLARSAWEHSKNVAYFSFEMGEARLMSRLLSAPAKMNAIDISRDPVTAKKNISRYLEAHKIVGQLRFKRYDDHGATVADMASYMRMLEDTQGFKADLVLVDYGDIVQSTADPRGGEVALQKKVYSDLRALANEFDVRVVTASQTQRNALNKYVITMSDIADSFDKVKIADWVVAICQTKEEESAKTGRLYMAKIRNNEGQGSMIPMVLDFGRSQFIEADWDGDGNVAAA